MNRLMVASLRSVQCISGEELPLEGRILLKAKLFVATLKVVHKWLTRQQRACSAEPQHAVILKGVRNTAFDTVILSA